MSATETIDLIAAHMANLRSTGWSSVDRTDTLEDGRQLGHVVAALMRNRELRTLEGRHADLVPAIRMAGNIWDAGFDLVQFADITDSGETIGAALDRFMASPASESEPAEMSPGF